MQGIFDREARRRFDDQNLQHRRKVRNALTVLRVYKRSPFCCVRRRAQDTKNRLFAFVASHYNDDSEENFGRANILQGRGGTACTMAMD